jgi:hypothetical protein
VGSKKNGVVPTDCTRERQLPFFAGFHDFSQSMPCLLQFFTVILYCPYRLPPFPARKVIDDW